MSFRGGSQRLGYARLGIGLLVLSLVHAPLPEPDFHNLRHHDAPGEVCEHHDHLLRWHPGAGVARDVAVLHWHWFLPTDAPSDLPRPGEGPALHAHVPDWLALTWDSAPSLSPDTSSRHAPRPASSPAPFSRPVELGPFPSADHPPSAFLAFSATFAPRASLAALLQRWVC